MSPKRILVVEDEMLVSASIQDTLKKLGYEIAGSAASGEEAIGAAVQTRPDLILMDINLRGTLDGIQTAQRIRAILNAPIVFATAYSDPATLQRAKITEPYGYVVKPFTERDLEITISIALYRKQIDNEKDALVAQLQQALREVKRLNGMLPICFRCKKIRDDKGYWKQVEQYITERAEVQFSHGLCPECAAALHDEWLGTDERKPGTA